MPLGASTATDAEKAYRDGDFANAEALYKKLLMSSSSNRIYNHRYGVCLYEQNKELATAEKHLLKSKKQGVNLSLYYLGEVCFLQYKFDDAIAHYTAYIGKSTDKKRKAEVKELLLKSKQGKELLERTEDITFTSRVEVDSVDFFLNFEMTEEAGSYTNLPASIGEDSIAPGTPIYITGRGDRTFFSCREDNGEFNLYSKNRLLDKWSEKTNFGPNVNSESDEAFPFLMSDGKVLYYSSKGHGAFGNYDIFITRFNAGQNTYLPPQQLGMPFNSLGNDILLAIDEYNNIGWLASDRDSEKGKMTIYTFKPNETIKLMSTDDEQELRNAAMITNVIEKDTVVEITLVESKQGTEVDPEIYFVVNDTLIYANHSDFMNDDAKVMYIEYEETVEAHKVATKTVEKKRFDYSKTTDSQEKASLISEIMKLEEEGISLGEKKEKLLISVRRLEQETIRANGGYAKRKPKKVEAPKEEPAKVVEHKSPWETEAAKSKTVTKPYFYDKTLEAYYDQIYATKAIDKLIEANQQKADAADKQFWADYIMQESNKPEPEEGFFTKMFAYDTTFTPELTTTQIISKANKSREEAALMFVKSAYLNYYTLKGQNVILLESVNNNYYRQQMQGLMDRADFAFQQANQKAFVSDGVYTNNAQSLARSSMFLKEGIQMLESVSLTYLKYRYDKQNGTLKADRQQPVEKENTVTPTATRPVPVEAVDTITRTEVPEKTVSPQEEYRIQFGTYSRILTEADAKLKDVTSHKLPEKELYKHYTGHYKNQMDAAMALEEIKAQGHKDAFVVKFVDGVPEK